MKHHSIEPISRSEAEDKFQNGTKEDVRETLLSVTFHDPNREWVEGYCVQLLNSEDENTRAIAITCLGHLARIHGELDTNLVIPILTSLLSDPFLGGYASDALDDIKIFSSKQLKDIE